MTAYRESATSCGLCLHEVSPEALRRHVGVDVCARCFEGGAKDAATRWGLQASIQLHETRTQHGHVVTCRAVVTRPNPIELHAQLRLEGLGDRLGRLFGGERDSSTDRPPADHRVDGWSAAELAAAAAFDRRVWIEEEGLGLTMEVLSDPRVKLAALEALRVTSSVHLTRESVQLMRTETASSGFDGAELDAIELAAVALAIGIERAVKDASRPMSWSAR